MNGRKEKGRIPDFLSIPEHDFKIAMNVMKVMAEAYLIKPEYFTNIFGIESGEETDSTDFTITSQLMSGGLEQFTIDCNVDTPPGQIFTVQPSSLLTFLNDSDSTIRLTFFEDVAYLQPATSRFDLPHWEGKPCLQIDPHQCGTAPVNDFSLGAPAGATEISVNIHKMNSPEDWTSSRGAGGGPDMGINNP